MTTRPRYLPRPRRRHGETEEQYLARHATWVQKAEEAERRTALASVPVPIPDAKRFVELALALTRRLDAVDGSLSALDERLAVVQGLLERLAAESRLPPPAPELRIDDAQLRALLADRLPTTIASTALPEEPWPAPVAKRPSLIATPNVSAEVVEHSEREDRVGAIYRNHFNACAEGRPAPPADLMTLDYVVRSVHGQCRSDESPDWLWHRVLHAYLELTLPHARSPQDLLIQLPSCLARARERRS